MTDDRRNSPIEASILDFPKSSANHSPIAKRDAVTILPSANLGAVYRNSNVEEGSNLAERLESSGKPRPFDERITSQAHCNSPGRFHNLSPSPPFPLRKLSTDYARHASKTSSYGVQAECKI